MRGAKTLAELRALKEEALKPQAAKPPPATPPAGTTPAGGPPPDLANQPPVEGAPAAAGEGDATPPPAEGEQTPTPPTDPDAGARTDPDLEGDDLGEADGPLDIPTSKQLRISPSQHDKVGRLTTALMRRNRDWTMEQAIEAAKEKLGVAKPKQDPNAPPAPQDDLPKTVEEVDATLKTLKAQRREALISLRIEDATNLEDQIEALNERKAAIRENAAREQQESATRHQTAYAASEAKAIELYPFAAAGNENTPGGKRMLEIYQSLVDSNDPRVNDPNLPLILAQNAAAQLNIMPARKGTPTTQKPPAGAAPVVAAPKKQVLPGGASHTTPAPTNQPPADVARVSGIKTLADLRAERRRLGLPD